MALGVGLSINNTRAVIEAFFTRSGKASNEFVRTPKYGVNGKCEVADRAMVRNSIRTNKPKFPLSKVLGAVLEICFGLYMSVFIWIACVYDYAWASVPFLAIFAGGYMYVGVSTLMTLWQMHAEQIADAVAEPEPVSLLFGRAGAGPIK